MKKLLMILAALALVSCDTSYTDRSSIFIMPEEMKDCKVFVLRTESVKAYDMQVIWCPHADTTTIVKENKVVHQYQVVHDRKETL